MNNRIGYLFIEIKVLKKIKFLGVDCMKTEIKI